MITLRTTGVALTAAFCISNLSFADEASVRAYLASAESTSYLQQANTRIELIDLGSRAPADALVFQKFIGNTPLHGAHIYVTENADGSVARVFDDSTEQLMLRRDPINIEQGASVVLAEAMLPNAIESESKQVWFRMGDEAVLAWEVTSSLEDLGMPVSPTHFEMVIDANSGEVLSARQIDTKTYAPGSPEAEAGVFPRIVINNTIGAQGSRDYAAPFDAVISVSVGCTGTLIAPNVVLSARHCGIGAGTLIRFGDNSNSPDFTVSVQSSILPDGNGSLLDGGDVSIHILNSSVPANIAEPMRLIDETNDLEGMLAATLGYGYNGLGSSGHGFSADGRRWGGENIIDAYGSPASAGGSNIISTDFDNGTGGANTIPSSSSSPLEFEATTAPGDSGGPVLVQFGSEWVIAGVLSGGTSSTSVYGDISWWTGTAIYRDDIESAGGIFVTGLEILLPDGVPSILSSAGGETLNVEIVPSPEDPVVPGSGTFHVDTGSGFQDIPLSSSSATSFTATFPAPDECPTNVEYFISFELESGTIVTAPAGGSNTFSTVAADQVDFDNLYDFETSVGFTSGAVGDTATTGQWVRVNPNGTEAQPEDDNTPSGTIAWVTGQGSVGGSLGANDVDGGATTLVSNLIDLSGTESASIAYARWYSNNTGASPNADIFEVFVSDNDGADYVLVETVGPSGAGTSGGWIETGFNVSDFVNLTSTVRVKFVASDLGDGSIVEAGIDDVRVLGVSCSSDFCPADLNEDGSLDFFDLSMFLSDMIDWDGNTTFDFFDISGYLSDFAGCP
ncbi:MAG: trypsin-like serine protease [Phycisphaerales bacterium]|nr:trypsin-like serine protease [Phycisphaerales bacterium]